MTEPSNYNNESPEQWERYAELLRQQPGAVPTEDRSAQMLANINAAAAVRPGRQRMIRRVVAPVVSVATIIMVILLVNISTPHVEPAPRTGVTVSTKESRERPRQVRRPTRNRLPAPSIPSTPLPASVDSALMPKPSHFPVVDPIGPGGSRAPRTGGARPGGASGQVTPSAP